MTDTSRTGTTPYRIENPEEFARNMLRLFEQGGRAMSGLLERQPSGASFAWDRCAARAGLTS
jgi:hypothetical protein